MLDYFDVIRQNFIETYTTGPFVYVWFILGKTWWLFLPLFLLQAVWWYWTDWTTTMFIISLDFRILVVTVPRDSLGSPKGAEQMFASFWGMSHGLNFVEYYWLGKKQEPFSVELIGIDGHVRFIFRMPKEFKDFFETHIYAQYPEAEIMEVEDYTQIIPDDFLEKGYDMYGAEIMLSKEDAYPLRTYSEFEERLTQEFIDPMAALTESLSRLGKGEQVWLQWTCRPVPAGDPPYANPWKKEGEKIIKEKVEKLPAAQKNAIEKVLAVPINAIGGMIDQALEYEVDLFGGEQKAIEPMKMLSPTDYNIVQAIYRSISKLGFEVKGRIAYIAKKDNFLVPRGFTGPMGALQQFNDQVLNGFKLDNKTKTKIDYFMKVRRTKWRKKKLLEMMKTRTMWAGPKPFILNTEELATIFHFPTQIVKAERIDRTKARKAGPPTDLPIGR
ncbi:MAG: hypothetical protein ACD_63C00259G0002 [uncultured bacterium]|nr:MAG: hypothetical protein ACD_63C00259G0002 [uncultured bacterium]